MSEIHAGGAWSLIAYGAALDGDSQTWVKTWASAASPLTCGFCWLQCLLSGCSHQPLVSAVDSLLQCEEAL